MPHAVTRLVVDVAQRSHHVRVLGSGPPVVLLHLSPRSSVQVLPLAQSLADRFTVYCPDTPGYGQSEALSLTQPEITDFADATAGLLQTLGLHRPTLYGTHTGAEIALSLARRHPGCCARIVLDGLPLFTRQESEEQLRHYLPRFAPEWSGTHMSALWARVRDQLIFYPWYARGETNRLQFDPPSLEFHMQVIADLLAAGVGDAPNYATGYSAAFRHDTHEDVCAAARDDLPVTYLCRADDLLFPHLERVSELAPKAKILRLPSDITPWQQAIAQALQHDTAAPALPAQSPRAFFTKEGMLLRRLGPAEGPAKLLLHGHPGSGELLLPQTERADGPVWVPDLPGSGQSAPLDGAPETLAARIAAALAEAIPGSAMVETWFTGARIAAHLPTDRFRVTARHAPCQRTPQPSRFCARITLRTCLSTGTAATCWRLGGAPAMG
ncbi:hypothetical protein P775_24750 [Puniceibacterium antarcticum]|uniref:AB hydrolase-1 domain-containing protein n=1 Tax=Puniceibacterium antarcticum TaxID=1206336 RepID=A0A2G8R7M0_9RHOB|nr:alpha/beta hydrolase [Puniceibacterium antarcticum]PIL17138.1 hypothetical protein P775_24750 [Puniceibacterium antarcticum]